MKNAFGEFIREKRLALGLSMRTFAREVGMQPSNYCNVEAGVLPPPTGPGLERIAKALGLKRGTADYAALHDLAEQEVLQLDEERKATMVSNLLVVLCGEKDAQPVINAGTLYT